MLDHGNLKKRLDGKEKRILSPYAAFSTDAVRLNHDKAADNGYRLAYSIDTDRILNSHSYTRYIDKTQVFSLIRNDHITHRVLHVQLVSKIARSIGRALDLNEDLIEAISLGHDLGHTPFGHDGEKYLSVLCRQNGIGEFHHNIQSVHVLKSIEKKGMGWNLTLQTLDGIFCHNGEVHDTCLTPFNSKTFDALEQEMNDQASGNRISPLPMTLEGCVVRMADTISYIGRDIEDAIRLGLLSRDDLPETCTQVLGKTNGTMVYNMVTDIIENSIDKNAISYSADLSHAIRTLKTFNLKHIYKNPNGKKHLTNIQNLFEILFNQYLADLDKGNDQSVIITQFLSHMNDSYINSSPPAAIVRDFIAGMTDQYFIAQCPDHLKPSIISC